MTSINNKELIILEIKKLILKENNIIDNDNIYFNKQNLNINKIILIIIFYHKYNKKIDIILKKFNLNNNYCSLLELLYETKFDILIIVIKFIKTFYNSNNNNKNIIKYLKYMTVKDDLETYISEVLIKFIEENNIELFEKFIKTLYVQYNTKILNIFNELLQELIYHYDKNNIIFIKLIIENISNNEFIDIIKEETSFIFNLIVEYHFDIEFQKNIIDKNIPEDLLFNSIIDSIIYMGDEYLIEHSFNNEIKQTIIDNIENNNLNLLDIYKNYENKEELISKIDELNIEFNNFYSILLYIYNKFNINDKKDIIDTLNNNFINNLKFCSINTDNYIHFINSENKEFNWRKKSPLLLVYNFGDKSKKRKIIEIKLNDIPFDMIREIIKFI